MRLCAAGMESSASQPGNPRLLHFAVARLGNADGLEENLAAAIRKTMSFSDELFDKALLCAFIGALDHEAECNSKVCKTVMKSVKQWGLHDAIFTTLEEIMQVLFTNKIAASCRVHDWSESEFAAFISVVAEFD